MKRREFLQHLHRLGLLTLASAVPGITLFPRMAQGLTGKDQGLFFVLLRAEGGWDITLSLDPKIHQDGSQQEDLFIEYRPDEILDLGGIRLGPACSAMKAHQGDFSVINGLFMSDSNVSHEANLDYVSTGNNEGQSADLPVDIAHAMGPKAFGVIFNGSLKRGSRQVMPTTIDNLDSLRNSINLSLLSDLLPPTQQETDFSRAQESLINSQPERQEYIRLFAEVDQLTQNPSANWDKKQQALAVASAFLSGLSSQALFDLRVNLDTHDNHEGRHLSEQRRLWDDVSQFLSLFKKIPYRGARLFDSTVFMVVSEFSRTPALNAAKGKDHNPMTNSALISGPGLRGGLTLGQSHLVLRGQSRTGEPRHAGLPVDFQTGQVAKSRLEAKDSRFQFIFPENLVATIAQLLQLDRSRLSALQSETQALHFLLRST